MVSEDEMAGWNHWCSGHELGQTPGDGEDREAWHTAVHGVARSWTQPNDWTRRHQDRLACWYVYLNLCPNHEMWMLIIWRSHQSSLKKTFDTLPCPSNWASLVAQMVKNLPVMQKILGQEDPLEKGMAIHSSILTWRIPWTEEHGGV